MGHELAHVQNRDILIGSIAATFAGAISYLAHMAQWAMIFGGRDNEDRNPAGDDRDDDSGADRRYAGADGDFSRSREIRGR